jgi:hypothetical protein
MNYHKFATNVGAWFADAKAKAGAPRISVSTTVDIGVLKRIVENAERNGAEEVKLSTALWNSNNFIKGTRMPAMTGSMSYAIAVPSDERVSKQDRDGIDDIDNIIRSTEADKANRTVNAKVVRRGRPRKVEAPAFTEAQLDLLRSMLTSR